MEGETLQMPSMRRTAHVCMIQQTERKYSRLLGCNVFRRNSAAKRSEFVDRIQGWTVCTNWEHSICKCLQGG